MLCWFQVYCKVIQLYIYIYIYILIFIDFKKILVIIYHPHKAKTVKTVFGSDDGLSLN